MPNEGKTDDGVSSLSKPFFRRRFPFFPLRPQKLQPTLDTEILEGILVADGMDHPGRPPEVRRGIDGQGSPPSLWQRRKGSASGTGSVARRTAVHIPF